MAFVLSQKQSYTWPVEYKYPKGDGRTEKVEFTAEYKRLQQSRLDEMGKRIKAEEIEDDEIIAEILVGWSGIKTSEGDDFEYSEANRRILLDLPGIRTAIILAWHGSLVGAARKN